jgi:hypothetical protein
MTGDIREKKSIRPVGKGHFCDQSENIFAPESPTETERDRVADKNK